MNTYLTDASVHVPEPSAQRTPTYDEIAERALGLCARSLASASQHLEAWVEAEQQLRQPQPARSLGATAG